MAESSLDDGGGSRRRWLVLAGMAVATLIAFRSVLMAPFGLFDPSEFDYWFFIPDRDSGALSVLIACWLLWNRRARFAAIRTCRIDGRHWLAAALVLVLFLWAIWVRIQVQQIPILCLLMVTLAVAWGGRRGLGPIALPCLALLLAFPPPAPLQAEIIWRLQALTAAGAHGIMTLAGYAVQREGTELLMGDHAFVIIEACSGWRGIQILSLVGLAAAELCGLPFRRAILVVAGAIPLGILLNTLRACLVMLTQEEFRAEQFDSHTPQGIAVLLVGSVVLYAVAALLQRKTTASSDSSPEVDVDPVEAHFFPWAVFSLALPSALMLLSLLVPLTQAPLEVPSRYKVIFPMVHGSWRGTPLDLDYLFPYSTSKNSQFHVDYRDISKTDGGDVVDIFIAREHPTPSGLDRIPDEKLLLPSNDWTIVSRQPTRIWQFGIDAEQAIVSRAGGSQLAHVVAWRLHDRGLIRESLDSIFRSRDCETSPNECRRTVVRIVVPIHFDDDRGRDRAARTATRFIDHFVLPLKTLEIR